MVESEPTDKAYVVVLLFSVPGSEAGARAGLARSKEESMVKEDSGRCVGELDFDVLG